MEADSESLIAVLKGVMLLSAFEQKELEVLVQAFVPLQLQPGDLLYQAGEPTDGVYFLRSGTLIALDPYGKIPPKIQKAEQFIGTEAFLNQPQRRLTLRAESECELFFLDNDGVKRTLFSVPVFEPTLKVILGSQQMIERIPMDWLREGEQVNLMTRRHPYFLLLRAGTPILIFAALVLLANWVGPLFPLAAMAGLVIGFLICALWLAWSIHNWSNDFYLITNRRMVWVERIAGLYDSRQEAPLGTLISVGLKFTEFGRLIGYGDVIVRTFTGDICFERVGNARIIGKLIEAYWARDKDSESEDEAKEIRQALWKKFGKDLTDITPKEIQQSVADNRNQQPPHETSFFEWLFSDFLKVRYEAGGTTTYRKHWFVLIRNEIGPLLGMLVSAAFVIAVVTRNIIQIDYTMALVFGGFVFLVLGGALVYIYIDWRNDIFQLTPNQVIDIDKKPLGRETRRSAPLENILSIEYERNGILPILFNYGTVYITIGNSQLTFNDVYQPSIVQQDIFTRMGTRADEKEHRQSAKERARVAEWFRIYQEEIDPNHITHDLNQPSV